MNPYTANTNFDQSFFNNDQAFSDHDQSLAQASGMTKKKTETSAINRCEVCYKVFESKRNVQRHMLLHTGERPFKCDVCDRRFNQKPHLKSHMLVHLKSQLQ